MGCSRPAWSGDPVSAFGRGPERLAAAYRAAGLTQVETRIYRGARHETLNEINRDEVVGGLLDWCERAIRAGAGGADEAPSRVRDV